MQHSGGRLLKKQQYIMTAESILNSLMEQKLKHKLNLRSLLEMQTAEVFFAFVAIENDCYFLNEKVAQVQKTLPP
jgi:hypothetical protein